MYLTKMCVYTQQTSQELQLGLDNQIMCPNINMCTSLLHILRLKSLKYILSLPTIFVVIKV